MNTNNRVTPRSKAAAVDLSNVSDEPITQPRRLSMGTAPGQAMQNVVLRDELAQWEGAFPVRLLDPSSIARSKWANRHELSFSDPEFLALKADIESSGGNVQPIKVRRVVGEGAKYEIVFGHRRHQSCLELGIFVLAMIGEATEQELFAEMDRENRQRKDLRPYEQGLMYKKALDEKLFPSAKKLAESVGVDLTNLGKVLALARLPAEVISAFESPLDLQVRWGPELAKALESNSGLVFAVAKAIQNESPRPSSKQVLDRLTKGGSTVLPPASKKIAIEGAGGQTGSIQLDANDKSFVVSLKNIDPGRVGELKKLIQDFLS